MDKNRSTKVKQMVTSKSYVKKKIKEFTVLVLQYRGKNIYINSHVDTNIVQLRIIKNTMNNCREGKFYKGLNVT